MPKQKEKTSQLDEQKVGDVLLITSDISEADKECREVVERCSAAAVQLTENAHRDRLDRKKAAEDIMNGFIHYGRWCHMQRDDRLLHEQQEEVIISAPKRIVADAWSSNAVPVRKICRRKEDLENFQLATKPQSKTESVRSGQSGHSRMTKGSLRSKLKRKSMEMEGKKALQNIPDEDAEVAKPKIIKLTQQIVEDKDTGKRQRRSRPSDPIKKSDPKEAGQLAIDLGQTSSVRTKKAMTVGLKTGRLSMRSTNAYKYHPNKPYTFDHTGRKMAVIHIKPDKLPNNRVTPKVSFQEKEDMKEVIGPSSPKQGRKSGAARKSRKKTPKQSAEPVAHRINNVVPVQPRIETICRPAEGVTLKSESGVTLKGPEPNKKNISNLSRAEYQQYIGTLRSNAPKTQVFETRRKKQSQNSKHHDATERCPSAERVSLPSIR